MHLPPVNGVSENNNLLRDCLLHMTETWKKGLDEGLIVGVLLIDFGKAFDTINHKILEKKLQGCGIAGQI